MWGGIVMEQGKQYRSSDKNGNHVMNENIRWNRVFAKHILQMNFSTHKVLPFVVVPLNDDHVRNS